MKPLGSITIKNNGEDEKRIGPNKRNKQLPCLDNIESHIERLCPLTVSFDVKTIQPPYFSEFSYHDCLGGIGLTTMSSEINARLTKIASEDNCDLNFPIGTVMDKYVLSKYPKKHKKVIFLAGSNSMDLIDQCKLQQLVHEDDEWVIKLHPVTTAPKIREIASVYGYHRLIDPNISGFSLLETAEQIACMQTSELYLVARLLGKPVIDFTRYDKAWLTAYHQIIRLLDNTDNDRRIINNVLMSELSGYIRPEYSNEIMTDRINKYYSLAMEERNKFKMLTNQKLIVADKTILDWK